MRPCSIASSVWLKIPRGSTTDRHEPVKPSNVYQQEASMEPASTPLRDIRMPPRIPPQQPQESNQIRCAVQRRLHGLAPNCNPAPPDWSGSQATTLPWRVLPWLLGPKCEPSKFP